MERNWKEQLQEMDHMSRAHCRESAKIKTNSLHPRAPGEFLSVLWYIRRAELPMAWHDAKAHVPSEHSCLLLKELFRPKRKNIKTFQSKGPYLGFLQQDTVGQAIPTQPSWGRQKTSC
jgi:hypothetical protein